MPEDKTKKPLKAGLIAYPFRIMGYYFGIAAIVIYHGGFYQLNPTTVILITWAFIYPHLGVLLYKFSGNSREVEYANLCFDALLLGGFINLMEFAFIPSMVFGAMIISSHAALLGLKRVLISFILTLFGILSIGIFNDFTISIVSTSAVNTISTVALSLFSIVYSYLGYLRYASLKKAKKDIKKQEEELTQKGELLERMNKEKDYLLGIAAHDLKSPLNQIIALIQIIELSEKKLSKKQRENFEYITKSAERMREMIGKILDVNAIESGDFNFSYQVFDLRIVAEETLENFKNDAEFKNIKLKSQITKQECFVRLDQSYLVQVIENLLSNAIKFTEPGKSVTIITKKIGEKICLGIKDEGPGISQEEQMKLFNKFQKLSAKPTGNEPSTGLGLSIVKKYTEAMGGVVWCESELGSGALFYLEFEEVLESHTVSKQNLQS